MAYKVLAMRGVFESPKIQDVVDHLLQQPRASAFCVLYKNQVCYPSDFLTIVLKQLGFDVQAELYGHFFRRPGGGEYEYLKQEQDKWKRVAEAKERA